ncbi:MAG: hypothetical protein CMJ58_25500 [Planctomycetaceae bacterium]|nr:hypothetical protein [Planctomycetaceae bacterium]
MHVTQVMRKGTKAMTDCGMLNAECEASASNRQFRSTRPQRRRPRRCAHNAGLHAKRTCTPNQRADAQQNSPRAPLN